LTLSLLKPHADNFAKRYGVLSWAHRLLLCGLMLCVAVCGLSVTLRELLGPLHHHAQHQAPQHAPGTHHATATLGNVATDRLVQRAAQAKATVSPPLWATTAAAVSTWIDARRAVAARAKSQRHHRLAHANDSGEAHDHVDLSRHRHTQTDATVVVMEPSASEATVGADGGGSAVTKTPTGSLTLAFVGDVNLAFSEFTRQAWRLADHVQPASVVPGLPERPPRG
jgi:hypothetical protein